MGFLFLIIIRLSSVPSSCKSKFVLFCVKAEVAVNVFDTCGLSVWLPLCSWSWFDVNGGLSEFQALAVCLPACYLIFH